VLDRLTEPLALRFLAQVCEFEPHRGRIEVAQSRRHVSACADIESKCKCGHELEVRGGDAVELRRELGGARRWRSERIELHSEVAVLTDRVDERRGASNFAKVDGVRGYRRRALVPTAEVLGEAEKLAPGLVD